jgi:hypothetical protein
VFVVAGPAAEDGLHLESFRVQNGLSATVQLASKYQAFPGIINGGIISALFDCHGNWTAAIALMDRAKLPRPPLTLTAELLVSSASPVHRPERICGAGKDSLALPLSFRMNSDQRLCQS